MTVRPTTPYETVKRRKPPKVRKSVRAKNAKRGGERFPKGRDERLRDFARHQPCLIAGHPDHPRCELSEKTDRVTRDTFYGCDAAHVLPKSRGKGDWNYIVPLCRLAHRLQEGRNPEFEFRFQQNLKRAGKQMTAAYLKHRGFR